MVNVGDDGHGAEIRNGTHGDFLIKGYRMFRIRCGRRFRWRGFRCRRWGRRCFSWGYFRLFFSRCLRRFLWGAAFEVRQPSCLTLLRSCRVASASNVNLFWRFDGFFDDVNGACRACDLACCLRAGLWSHVPRVHPPHFGTRLKIVEHSLNQAWLG